MGEKLATQLAQASKVASSRSNRLLEESSGGPKWAWFLFAPPFLLNTPPAFFWWFFFRKVTESYEFRNDTCFLSVMLRNLADYIIILFLTYGMLQNPTNCATMLPFDFRYVTEPYGLCINIFSTPDMSWNFTDCLTMGVKYLEAVMWRSHPTKQMVPRWN